MQNKNALTRYRLIDNRMTMKQKSVPTLQDLVNYVSERMGAPISVASIQKDIYAMRYNTSLGFSAPIEYSAEKKGYIYTDPNYSIRFRLISIKHSLRSHVSRGKVKKLVLDFHVIRK